MGWALEAALLAAGGACRIEPLRDPTLGAPSGEAWSQSGGLAIGAGSTTDSAIGTQTAPAWAPTPGDCYTLARWASPPELTRLPTAANPVPLVMTTDAHLDSGMHTLTFFDGYWFSCGTKLIAIHPGNGTVTELGLCEQMFQFDGALWVLDPVVGRLKRHDTAADAQGGLFAQSLPADAYGGAGRSAASPATVFQAWHAGTEVSAFDLATGAETVIPLEGYDGRIDGLDAEGGVLRVLDGSVAPVAGVASVWTFSPTSGALIAVTPFAEDTLYFGLYCEPQ